MPVITATEYLEINSVPLATPAWRVLELFHLWDGPDERGEDRIVPGAAGVRPYPRRATVTRRALPMVIFGDKDQDGVAQANPRAGLWANVNYLRTNVCGPGAAANGTRTAILRAPGGVTRTGPVHVSRRLMLARLGPATYRAVLELSIPAGALA